MKRTFLLMLAGLYGGGMMMAQSGGSEDRVWFTDREYSTTGVTNEGMAVMFETWNTPYELWNPRTGEQTVIGGVGPGNNVGGAGRFSDDGKTVSAVMESDAIEVTTAWEKTVKDAAQGYTVNVVSYVPDNDNTLFALAKSTDNQKSLMFSSYNNGLTWTGDRVWVMADASGTGGGNDAWEGGMECMAWLNTSSYVLAGGHNGVLYLSTNMGTSFTKVVPAVDGGYDVDTYWSMDFLTDESVLVNEAQRLYLYKYGVLGVELADGTGAVWYTDDATDTYNVASGVNGVPMSITHAGNVYFLVTSNGLIQKSEDYGKTWTDVYSQGPSATPWVDGGAPLFTNIKFADETNGMALGVGGVYVTTDGGKTWQGMVVSDETSDVTWNDVVFANGKATIVGTEGFVYESSDMGQTWRKVSVTDADGLGFHAVYDNAEGINVLGEDGVFFHRNHAENVSGYTAAVYDIESGEWTPMQGTGYFSGETASGADDISGDGTTVVGGAYNYEYIDDLSTIRYDATAWMDGEIVNLGNKFAGINRSSKACKTNYDGSVIVGWQDHHGPWFGSVWRKNTDGGYDQSLMIAAPTLTEDDVNMSDTPEGYLDMNSKLLGQCNAVSSDGKIIGGRGGSNYAVNGPWLWSEEKGLQLLYDEPYADYMVYDMTNDGSFVVGQAGQGGSSFFWTEETGFMEANKYVETVLGIDMQGYSICGIYDLSPNGRYITGWCMKGAGKYAYVLDLKGDIPTSIEKELEQTKAAVYPNPVSNELHVDLPFDDVKTRVSLYSLQGACVKSVTTMDMTNVIDVTGIPDGLYILDVNANGTHKSFKVTVKH